MVGLLVAYLDNQFYPIVLERLSRALQHEGYHTLLFFAEGDAVDEQLDVLLDYQIDALVMASVSLTSDLAEQCRAAGIPVVLFNREGGEAPVCSVVSDNLDGGAQMADHLLDGGYQRIAYLAGSCDSSTNRDRESGFVEGLVQRGQELHARALGNYDAALARTATLELMEAASPPDAIFVANDHMAFAVMDTLRSELGLSIPEQVAVAGFDDVPQANWAAYALTSVRQSVDDLVAGTVSTLKEQLETRGSVTRIVLPVRLVARSSTGNASPPVGNR